MPDREPLAKVVERGERANKMFVVVLCVDEKGREKDLRSFGVEGGGRYDPVREKAERFAERVNAAASAWLDREVKKKVKAVEVVAKMHLRECQAEWELVVKKTVAAERDRCLTICRMNNNSGEGGTIAEAIRSMPGPKLESCIHGRTGGTCTAGCEAQGQESSGDEDVIIMDRTKDGHVVYDHKADADCRMSGQEPPWRFSRDHWGKQGQEKGYCKENDCDGH